MDRLKQFANAFEQIQNLSNFNNDLPNFTDESETNEAWILAVKKLPYVIIYQQTRECY